MLRARSAPVEKDGYGKAREGMSTFSLGIVRRVVLRLNPRAIFL